MTIAYLSRKMQETFSNSIRVLSELKYRFPNNQPRTMLDFGAGLGNP